MTPSEFWARLKDGDLVVWEQFHDLVRAAGAGEAESREFVAHLLAGLAALDRIPCCADCARCGVRCSEAA